MLGLLLLLFGVLLMSKHFTQDARNRPYGLAGLGSDGKIDRDYLPSSLSDPFPDNIIDNGDSTHPVSISFDIDPYYDVDDIILTVYTSAFRAYASSIPSGGGSTTPSGGGFNTGAGSNHSHLLTSTFHTHGISAMHSHIISEGSYPTGSEPGHWHSYNRAIGTSSVSPGSTDLGSLSSVIVTAESQHTHYSQPHTHDTPNHTHDIRYGIYEYKYGGNLCYAGTNIFVNDDALSSPNYGYGTRGNADNAIKTSLSLLSLYVKGGSKAPDVIVDGSNTISVLPLVDAVKNTSGLLRIGAKVQVRYR
jgi:hypothetical protein